MGAQTERSVRKMSYTSARVPAEGHKPTVHVYRNLTRNGLVVQDAIICFAMRSYTGISRCAAETFSNNRSQPIRQEVTT